ncbi:hypothetical protein [Candidatus Pristimantibacillus sp. PTI5]|uniref:hypothetical protein n=1 Tax=Candidatus Pristimantibacillus sp. PTI5 TaxID=3400422 RepID=UPI003B01C3C3
MKQFIQQTEKWLLEECESQLGATPAQEQLWDAVKDFNFDVTQLKRWFAYLTATGTVSDRFSIDVFSLPRMDSFESDDLIVLYEDRVLVSGLGLRQFTAGSHCWNSEGLERFFTLLQLGHTEITASHAFDAVESEWTDVGDEEGSNEINEGMWSIQSFEDEVIDIGESEEEIAPEEVAIADESMDRLIELQGHITEGLQKIDQSVEESMKLHTTAPAESKRLVKLLLAAETELEQARMLITQPENEV